MDKLSLRQDQDGPHTNRSWVEPVVVMAWALGRFLIREMWKEKE